MDYLREKIDETEQSTIDSMVAFKNKILEFQDRMKEVNSLKKEFEKLSADVVTGQIKLETITRQTADEKTSFNDSYKQLKKANDTKAVHYQSKQKILDMKVSLINI